MDVYLQVYLLVAKWSIGHFNQRISWVRVTIDLTLSYRFNILFLICLIPPVLLYSSFCLYSYSLYPYSYSNSNEIM